MALELALSDPFGNDYPNAYRKLSCLIVDCDHKAIVAVFSNFKDADARNGGKEPVSKTEYRIGPDPVPPRLADDGKTVVEPAIPSYDQFKAADDVNQAGISATVYGYVKTRSDNAGAKDV